MPNLSSSRHVVLTHSFNCRQLFSLSRSGDQIAISEERASKVRRCRAFLEQKLTEEGGVFYGINTGFGALCNTIIPKEELKALQLNLIRSHAVGMGDEVPTDIVRLMLLLKVITLSEGYSGVREGVISQLIALFNNHLHPVVFQLGSLGASGDLAPLAHLALALVGEGSLKERDAPVLPSSEVLETAKIEPLVLESKEGLALLNGTQFMSAYGVWLVAHSHRIYAWAQAVAALSSEAFMASDAPFHPALHSIRPHIGQQRSAEQIVAWRADSKLSGQAGRVQDPYSFRCIPQVHGASWDTIQYVERIMDIEINATTDNPNLFPDEDLILSGGNFHGQPLALPLDFLSIALAELGSISERRSYQLLSGANGTTPFLAGKPGVESGLMITQYLAASIVSANKQLCTPASIDTIPSSNGQEDHVSMGANAATKCYRVAENIYRILAVELLTACTAITADKLDKLAPALLPIWEFGQAEMAVSDGDRYLSPELLRLEHKLRENDPPTPFAKS